MAPMCHWQLQVCRTSLLITRLGSGGNPTPWLPRERTQPPPVGGVSSSGSRVSSPLPDLRIPFFSDRRTVTHPRLWPPAARAAGSRGPGLWGDAPRPRPTMVGPQLGVPRERGEPERGVRFEVAKAVAAVHRAATAFAGRADHRGPTPAAAAAEPARPPQTLSAFVSNAPALRPYLEGGWGSRGLVSTMPARARRSHRSWQFGSCGGHGGSVGGGGVSSSLC
jgi:hypothetical protein